MMLRTVDLSTNIYRVFYLFSRSAAFFMSSILACLTRFIVSYIYKNLWIGGVVIVSNRISGCFT